MTKYKIKMEQLSSYELSEIKQIYRSIEENKKEINDLEIIISNYNHKLECANIKINNLRSIIEKEEKYIVDLMEKHNITSVELSSLKPKTQSKQEIILNTLIEEFEKTLTKDEAIEKAKLLLEIMNNSQQPEPRRKNHLLKNEEMTQSLTYYLFYY